MIKPVSEIIAEARTQINCASVAEAKSIAASDTDTLIIDVREPTETENSKLTDSVAIPRGQLEMKITSVAEIAEQPILVHCAAGGRASLAALTLQNMGYQKVYAITAAYDEIKQQFG